jgi:hypothetical protein
MGRTTDDPHEDKAVAKERAKEQKPSESKRLSDTAATAEGNAKEAARYRDYYKRTKDE